MKDPNFSTSTNLMPAGEVILSSQFGSEENPFAEYMWMENEEEFNRQVRTRQVLFPNRDLIWVQNILL